MPHRPPDITTVTPYLTVHGAAAAIDFYVRAFAAEERYRLEGEGGRIEHATLRIGDATLYLADAPANQPVPAPAPAGGPTSVMLFMYVPDCDAVWRRALAAGASELVPMADQEWGDRFGQLRDPFGHVWGIATMRATGDQPRAL